jgi:putative tryptophan/tyrosine transport system substrate-binding protein
MRPRLVEQQAGGLLINTDASFFSQRDQLIDLTKRHAIPAIFDRREFVEAGGLISYGGSVTDVYHLAGIYTGRILGQAGRLASPAVHESRAGHQPQDCNSLGLTIPLPLLARADEVIE